MNKTHTSGGKLWVASLIVATLMFPSHRAWGQLSVSHDMTVCGMPITSMELKRVSDRMTLQLNYKLKDFNLKGDRVAVFQPLIVNESDTLELDPIGLYSHLRYVQYLRYGEHALGGDREKTMRYSKRQDMLAYTQSVAYEEWMNGAHVELRRRDYGCCNDQVDEMTEPLGLMYKQVLYEPTFHYIRPVAVAQKSYELSGRAYIEFPVNRTELFPDFRNNRKELAKITATIDSVRNDEDVTVTSLEIKGFASPEGKYDNNVRLAKGRTETLKNYVQRLYSFDYGFIKTDYEPEDWAGLKEWVEKSSLYHRNELLDIINDPTLDPDAKDWRMRIKYTDDYNILLNDVYPGLRHSDYRIAYTVRNYSTPEEIREVLAKAPQKLSLNEMYILAQSLEPGSDEYNEVFKTAVRMFPDDETANLNAANAAMGIKDYASATRYLEKAGTGAEAVYARGVLCALQGNYNEALKLVQEAESKGLADTAGVQDHIKEVIKYLPTSADK